MLIRPVTTGLYPELRMFRKFSWVIVMHRFVGRSDVYLKIIKKYEEDHHVRDLLTRDRDYPHFFTNLLQMSLCQLLASNEQDKSSDIEKQPRFRDRK